ncbi:hypothetical protein TgHK011_008114 [Trichoderma gracile]|nr:hypothetical protein TgHK011_008114 [Trichoderma gracile]
MPQLSDIEEASSSGSTIEENEDQSRQRTKDHDQEVARLDPHGPSPGDLTLRSIGKAQGLKLRQASHAQEQQRSLPTSMTVFSPALPPPLSSSSPPASLSSSSSSSSRTITPPHTFRPNPRVSSSGTVQIVSPGATSGTAFPSGGWSPLGRVVSGRVGSETSSTATGSAYDHQMQGQQQRQRQEQQYGLGGVPPAAGRTPFWWTDGSTVDLPRRGDGDGDGERRCLLGTGQTGNGVEDRRVEMRWLVHVVVHGVVLAMQSGAAVGVLTVFAWMGMWTDEGGLSGGDSGEMLRSISSLATTSVLILSFTTLVFHEIYLLSPVVLLYLQAAILALATVAATGMWMKCVQEESGIVKCVLMSCGMLLWVTCGIAFLRAAVVWRVTSWGEDEGQGTGGEDEGEGAGGERVQGYATFRGR